MSIKNKEKWGKYIENNKDPYGKACIKIAEKVMEYLDKEKDFDSENLIHRADNELNYGISGFMAGVAASIIYHCHSRGEEFKKSWDKNIKGDIVNGVKNPAVLTIKYD